MFHFWVKRYIPTLKLVRDCKTIFYRKANGSVWLFLDLAAQFWFPPKILMTPSIFKISRAKITSVGWLDYKVLSSCSVCCVIMECFSFRQNFRKTSGSMDGQNVQWPIAKTLMDRNIYTWTSSKRFFKYEHNKCLNYNLEEFFKFLRFFFSYQHSEKMYVYMAPTNQEG
jgi:hypothetical protein